MKTIEQKADEYAIDAMEGIIYKYQEEPWDKFKDALAEIYLAGAREALGSQWRHPDELKDYECDRVISKILTIYRSRYEGSWLTLTTVNSVDEWTDNYDRVHKGDKLIAWMPIPEYDNNLLCR